MRRAGVVAWVVCAVAFVMAASGAVLSTLAPSRPAEEGGNAVFAIGTAIAIIAFAIVGALIASRRPDNRMGWLFLAAAVIFGGGTTAGYYAAVVPPLPRREIGAWLSGWTVDGPGFFTLFVFFLLLFPSGHLPSPRWRYLARASVALTAGLVFFLAFKPGTLVSLDRANPFAIAALGPIWKIAELPLFLGTMACVPAAAVAFVLRFRRSRGVEREQLKWFLLAAVFIGIAVAVAPAIFAIKTLWWVWPVVFFAAFTSIPVAAGIAILRYRLYDIDRVISRTLSYALVTVLLGGTFALVVLVPTAVIGVGGRGTPDWLVAVATLVIAALFRPVRRRVQNAVDHRFNRARYDAATTIDAFTTRLRDEIDIDTLEAELRGVVSRTMQPRHITVWLRGGFRT